MCGIAGKLSWTDPVAPALLARMCAVLEHRGPDSRGIFLGDGVGLGVQRLAIIDLETGDQPIFNEDRSVVVVLNGEIYNYRELREDLATRGHRLATRSDTEVIVHLYEEHGDACVEHLRGMFAFALWDVRRRRLLLARDRVGKKPLLYAPTPDGLVFASEARAILQDPSIPRDVDWTAVDRFLHYQYVPHPQTAFSALRKLPPAHVLVCEEGGLRTRRYWKLSYRDRLAGRPDAELEERIRACLLEATALRLRSDVPVGALLSGGIDSSAVVSAMTRTGTGQVKTFSIGFDVPDFDERTHARQVARMHATDHHELVLGAEAMDVLPRLVWHYGEPFADQSAIATFHLAQLAGRHVRVVLNGDGGDESFAGYNRYVGLTPSSPRSRLARRSTRDRAVLEQYARRLAYFDDDARLELYAPEFADTLDAAPARGVLERFYRTSDASNLTERLLDVDVHTYLSDDLLVKMDIASMAHSLEVRSPLLDHVFMEMAASLPAAAKLHGEQTKRLFKAALAPWLPEEIRSRPKQGFSVPLAHWFAGPLRELPAEILLDPRSLGRGLFREQALRDLLGPPAATDEGASRIWALMQLELWLRSYVDQAPAAAPMAAL